MDRVAILLANSLRIRLRLDEFLIQATCLKKPHYLRVAQSIPVIQTVFPQLFWCECFLQDVLIHVQLLLLPPASCTVHIQCLTCVFPIVLVWVRSQSFHISCSVISAICRSSLKSIRNDQSSYHGSRWSQCRCRDRSKCCRCVYRVAHSVPAGGCCERTDHSNRCEHPLRIPPLCDPIQWAGGSFHHTHPGKLGQRTPSACSTSQLLECSVHSWVSERGPRIIHAFAAGWRRLAAISPTHQHPWCFLGSLQACVSPWVHTQWPPFD